MFVHIWLILALCLVGFKDPRWCFCEVSSSTHPACLPPSVLGRNLLVFPRRLLIWVYFGLFCPCWRPGGRERGSAGPGGSLQDGFLLPACPAAAGEGFRLCNFTPHFLKRCSEAAADPNTSIFPRMVKSLFLTLGLEPHQVVPEAALQPVQVPALTAWCHCQAWPHVPVTLRDVGQHQPHPQPPLIFILLYFHS